MFHTRARSAFGCPALESPWRRLSCKTAVSFVRLKVMLTAVPFVRLQLTKTSSLPCQTTVSFVVLQLTQNSSLFRRSPSPAKQQSLSSWSISRKTAVSFVRLQLTQSNSLFCQTGWSCRQQSRLSGPAQANSNLFSQTAVPFIRSSSSKHQSL